MRAACRRAFRHNDCDEREGDGSWPLRANRRGQRMEKLVRLSAVAVVVVVVLVYYYHRGKDLNKGLVMLIG